MVSAPEFGETLVIYRDPEIVQETDYQENDPFPAETHEAALDLLTMIAQANRERIDRAIKLPVGSGCSDLSIAEPDAGKVLLWNDDETGLENGPTGDEISNAQTYAVSAGESASQALAWAEGTEPGGSGTKSAKEWAEEAEEIVSAPASVITYDNTASSLTASNVQDALDEMAAYVYGVRWNQSTDNMEKGLVIGGLWVPCEYDEYPVQEQMGRGLYVASTGAWTALDAEDSTLLAAGGSADLTGASGDVMVRIPSHYQLWVREGDFQYILVSEKPFSFKGTDAWTPLCFDGEDHYYIGAFEGVLDDNGTVVQGTGAAGANTSEDKLRSLPYYTPWTDEIRATYRMLSSNLGDEFHQYNWDAHQMLVALMVTEWGSWDSQTELPGYTEASGWNYAYVRQTGRTLGLGNASGSILVDLGGVDSDLSGVVASNAYIANSYRGVENIFGHLWFFLDGINIDNTSGDCDVYVSSDYATWADDTSTNYTDTGHGPAFGDGDGYIADILGSGRYCPLYPSSISGGSSATYLFDYHSNTSGAWRTLLSGGRLTGGGADGIAYLSVNTWSGSHSSDVGSRIVAR